MNWYKRRKSTKRIQYTFVYRISFDAYNEGEHDEFQAVVGKYYERFGYYLKRILVYKIYRSYKNKYICQKHI